MKKINFGNENWQKELQQAYSFRFSETPDFVQQKDYITTAVNPDHREGFDNISLLSPTLFGTGVKARLRCAFDGLGCPEIILVEKTENCADGAVRYGACFEIVLWKNGVNVWRHYMDETNHRCWWHKRLGLNMPVAEKEIHELEVEVGEQSIAFSVDGISAELRTEDLPERFYVGVTACEGIVRLYGMQIEQEEEPMLEQQEKEKLEALYAGCRVYHGELHDHSNSGGTSDGKVPLADWPGILASLKMDFAAILDHRQVRHMYQPEWQDGLFIAGTEPGTHISDSKAEVNGMHYNILLPHRDELAKLLEAFPEYQFTGGIEGHFEYPHFTTERFGQLIDAIKARGGLFVHPHPKLVMQSEDPCDYWFRDDTGLEVFYIGRKGEQTKANYALWTALLAAGKRIWPCAGCDMHSMPQDTALTTIYASEKSSAGYLKHLSKGDFTCGAVGIRMCIGDTVSGGNCNFEGERLIVCVDDFHESVRCPEHKYRLDILTNEGVVMSREIRCDEPAWISLDAQDCDFYRAEVFDETRSLRIAIGSPIWNAKA